MSFWPSISWPRVWLRVWPHWGVEIRGWRLQLRYRRMLEKRKSSLEGSR